MALTNSGKKVVIMLVAFGVLGGGYFIANKHKAAIVAPPAVVEQVAPVVETVPIQKPVSSVVVAPVKKHTAGHVAKHVQEKHQKHTKSTPTLSGSTTHHKAISDEAALKELSKEGGM